ncbi:MAG TPA: hypothetical protein PKJ92_08510 [Accumulibacter sp.]|nr:hypothetical protein [Accumulibacter sp.]
MTVSMRRQGDGWDNAPLESANGTVKVECVHGEHFRTRAEAQQARVESIGYDNTEVATRPWATYPRPHSSSAGMAPRRRPAPVEDPCCEQHCVIHRRPVSGSSQATEPASRG